MPKVSVFKPFPFEKSQEISIEDSPRSGDWEVIGITEHKVTLRCPISKKEFTWSRFCYLAEENDQAWPQPD